MLKFFKKIIGKEKGAKPPAYIPLPKTVRDIVPGVNKKVAAKPAKKKSAAKKSTPKKKVSKRPARLDDSSRSGGRPPIVSKLKTVKPIGVVTHYYTEIKVAIVKFNNPPAIGAKLRFKGATTDFAEVLKSAQYDHKPVAKIPKGKEVGVKVKYRVRQGDEVHLEK
jgi:hypothetical protein